jgi:5-methylthioadenosine/S-adenosylhomocysteine deaminase
MVSKKHSHDSHKMTRNPELRGDSREKSRRGFLQRGIGMVAGVATSQLLPHPAEAAPQDAGNAGLIEFLRNPNGRPVLLKDGIILSMDPQVGDFEKGDVLLQGKKIVSVGPKAEMPKSAVVVNAAGMIVMPGMIDTHHHQYETILRSILADGVIPVGVPGPKNNYTSVIQGTFTPVYLPEDAHIAELLASLSQINDGVTTSVDTSQVQLTPDHTDACIAGLKESGRRAVFAYGAGGEDAVRKFPVELTRLRKQYFSSGDQLLTLAAHVGTNAEQWKIARSVGAPIVTHIVGTVNSDLDSMGRAGLMGPDNEYIHCTRLSDSTWKTIADTGGKISIAVAIEMQMQHGFPPLQQALDRGLRPSLSVDVECNMTADLFSVMRAAFTMQRVLANQRIIAKEENAPALITCRDVIEFATIDGSRAAHLDSKVGSLTPGKEADIVMLATDRLNTFPLNNVPGAIVTLMDTSNVENVFIAGKIVKWQGKLVGVDLSRIKAQAEKSRDGLLARSKFPRNLFGSCCIG